MLVLTLRDSKSSFVVVGHAGTRLSLLCTVGLLLTLLVFVALGHASPGDPLWLAGIYDGADLDESIEALTSIVGIVEGLLPGACNQFACVTRIVPRCDAPFPRTGVPTTFSVRAPPSA